MHYLSLCGIFKHETPYFAEWIEYHRMLGVEHFYLINNHPELEEPVVGFRKYYDMGIVEHIHYPITDAPQVPAYNLILQTFGWRTRWMAFMDFDEYINLEPNENLIRLLHDFDGDPRCGSLVLHWACYGSSGRQTRPMMHTDAYRFRVPLDDPGHKMVKSIVRTDRTASMATPHTANPKPGFVNMNTLHVPVEGIDIGHVVNYPPVHHRAWVNHYILRSKSEFEEKMARGIACGPSPTWRRELWDRIEEKATIYDDSICRHVPIVRERLLEITPMKTFADVPGWMNFEAVYDWIVANHGRDGAKFVEVGTWMGRSSIYMADLIKRSGKDIQFYAIDHFVGASDPELQAGQDYQDNMRATIEAHGGTIAGAFAKNVLDCGVQDYVTQIVADSTKAAKMFQDYSLDFVFIDAAHDYVSIKRDIAIWWPKVKVGGILAGHDYDHLFPGVVQAVNGFFDKKDYDARFIQGNVWGIKKEPALPKSVG